MTIADRISPVDRLHLSRALKAIRDRPLDAPWSRVDQWALHLVRTNKLFNGKTEQLLGPEVRDGHEPEPDALEALRECLAEHGVFPLMRSTPVSDAANTRRTLTDEQKVRAIRAWIASGNAKVFTDASRDAALAAVCFGKEATERKLAIRASTDSTLIDDVETAIEKHEPPRYTYTGEDGAQKTNGKVVIVRVPGEAYADRNAESRDGDWRGRSKLTNNQAGIAHASVEVSEASNVDPDGDEVDVLEVQVEDLLASIMKELKWTATPTHTVSAKIRRRYVAAWEFEGREGQREQIMLAWTPTAYARYGAVASTWTPRRKLAKPLQLAGFWNPTDARPSQTAPAPGIEKTQKRSKWTALRFLRDSIH